MNERSPVGKTHSFNTAGEQGLLGQRLFVVTAHPDDESYAAGMLYRNNRSGGSAVVVCATLGEKGMSHLKRPMTAPQLKARRKRELQRAAKIIGIKKVLTFTVPDGAVKNHTALLVQRYLKQARQYKPDAIIGFDHNGITGHWDHRAIGIVGLRVARILRLPYYAFSLPPRVIAHAEQWLKARRRASTYSKRLGFAQPTIRVAISATIKKRAIRAHASQMDSSAVYSGYPQWAVQELLKAEYFRKLN